MGLDAELVTLPPVASWNSKFSDSAQRLKQFFLNKPSHHD